MKKKIVWHGDHENVRYEINRMEREDLDGNPMEWWTFYLIIPLMQLPENVRERFWLEPVYDGLRAYYRYYEEEYIASLDWHIGCTYYEKIKGVDIQRRIVKIGCDYEHYWDEGHYYSLEYVEKEAKECIDSLWRMIPNMRIRCGWCGKWVEKNTKHAEICPKREQWHKEKEGSI